MTEVEIAKVGLTPDQLGILWICRDAPRPLNLTEIARVLFRSKATISELLTRMEKEGLIEKVHIRREPRSVRIKLTAKGEEACNRGSKSIRGPLTELMSAL
jgi:DNA-binding MarR family transcriptional regulator